MKETKRKKPCGSCPFKRDNDLEGNYPGGSHPFVYIGQAKGPFWLPCHKDKYYNDKMSDPNLVSQCRGAAIFRANSGFSTALPNKILSLPIDKETVFGSVEEFLRHYSDDNVTDEQIKELSTEKAQQEMLVQELQKIQL